MSKKELNWSRKIELFVKDLWSWLNGNLSYPYEFATKYDLMIEYDNTEGWVIKDLMPGIMLPKEKAPVAINWLLRTNNEDKTFRAEELIKAFKCFEAITAGSIEAEGLFLALKLYGRIAIIKIAELQQTTDSSTYNKIIDFITPLINQNINLEEVPFGKGGMTVEQIFNSHVGPIFNKQNIEQDNSLLGENELNDY